MCSNRRFNTVRAIVQQVPPGFSGGSRTRLCTSPSLPAARNQAQAGRGGCTDRGCCCGHPTASSQTDALLQQAGQDSSGRNKTRSPFLPLSRKMLFQSWMWTKK